MNDFDDLDLFVLTLGITAAMVLLIPILCFHLGGWIQ